MNIFNKVALQGLKKNHTRTFVTIMGVALSTALITAVAAFAVSLQNYMINGAAVKYGSWHIEIPNADSSFFQEETEDKQTADTTVLQNIGYAALSGGENPDKPYLFITGWNKKAFKDLPITMISGRLPENSNEVLIPAHIAANGGVKISVGDKLSLSVGSRMKGEEKLCQHDAYQGEQERLVLAAKKIYTVVGICQRPAIEEFTAPGYTLITTESAALEDECSAYVTLKNPYKIHSYVKKLPDKYSYVFNDDVLRFMGLSGEKMITILLYSTGGMLIALVMLGCISYLQFLSYLPE